MTVSTLPVWSVDMTGSVMMIVFSLLCLRLARRLRRQDRSNVIWTYMLWVCMALTLFAVSRSAGHILKQILLLSGRQPVWETIRPVSGGINTFAFILVGAVTLFFQQIWNVYQEITGDRAALKKARDELLYLNQNLEDLVAERTREMARSEHRYRRIFEVSRDMILVVDRGGTILDVNPIGHRTLGNADFDRGLVGRAVQDFFTAAESWDTILAAMDADGFVANAELDLRYADGNAFRALVTGSLDSGSGEGPDTVHLLIKDIEGRRRIERQMAQADKLASIGEFSAGIAHEINNPLGIILGYSQLLQRAEAPGSERLDDLKTIEKHVRNCKSIVEDLLNFARSSPPQMEPVRLHRVMDEVVDFILQHSRSNRITFEREYDPHLPAMVLDEKKIRQVLMNLIMNAEHAMAGEGTVRLAIRYDGAGHRAVVRVADGGHGIEKKNLSRIFDPFFTTKPTGEGTGLGLSVSYGIVKNHGGDIRVESRPGAGTVFTVTLPVNGGEAQ